MVEKEKAAVLVVDKSAPERKIVGKILGRAGFDDVGLAGDLNTAWTLLKSKPFGVMVLDWPLAEAAKFMLLRRIQADKDLAGLKVLVMVAAVTKERLAMAARAGAGGFLVKPFGPEALVEKLDQMLGAGDLDAETEEFEDEEPEQEAPKPRREKTGAARVATDEEMTKAKKLVRQGFKDLRQWKYDQAEENFGQAAELNPRSPEAFKALAEIAEVRGDAGKAGSLRMKSAENYIRSGQAGEAETLYKEMSKKDPAAGNPFKITGEKLKAEGDHDAAIETLERAAEMDPDDAEVVVSLSSSYMEKGVVDKAVDLVSGFLSRFEDVADFPILTALFKKLVGNSWEEYTEAVAEKDQDALQVLDDWLDDMEKPENAGKRVLFADRAVKLPKVSENLPVIDMSASGIGFKPMGQKFAVGQKIGFDLVAFGDPLIKKLSATVRRVSKNMIGCSFNALNSRQRQQMDEMLGNGSEAK